MEWIFSQGEGCGGGTWGGSSGAASPRGAVRSMGRAGRQNRGETETFKAYIKRFL